MREIPVCGDSQVIVWIPRIKLDTYFRAECVIQMLKKRIQQSSLLVVIYGQVGLEERPMRRWYVPLTVLGLGNIGAFLLSERGRTTLRAMFEDFREAPDRWLEWNESAQNELDRIQAALNRIAESLELRSQLGQ